MLLFEAHLARFPRNEDDRGDDSHEGQPGHDGAEKQLARAASPQPITAHAATGPWPMRA